MLLHYAFLRAISLQARDDLADGVMSSVMREPTSLKRKGRMMTNRSAVVYTAVQAELSPLGRTPSRLEEKLQLRFSTEESNDTEESHDMDR